MVQNLWSVHQFFNMAYIPLEKGLIWYPHMVPNLKYCPDVTSKRSPGNISDGVESFWFPNKLSRSQSDAAWDTKGKKSYQECIANILVWCTKIVYNRPMDYGSNFINQFDDIALHNLTVRIYKHYWKTVEDKNQDKITQVFSYFFTSVQSVKFLISQNP